MSLLFIRYVLTISVYWYLSVTQPYLQWGCHQVGRGFGATLECCWESHYLSQFWPKSMSPYGVTGPQWVNCKLLYCSMSWWDDVIRWKHFPCYWSFVWGIHRSPVNSLHKSQLHGALMFSLIFTRIKGWVNNGEAGDLRHHCAHYDVTVMDQEVVHPPQRPFYGPSMQSESWHLGSGVCLCCLSHANCTLSSGGGNETCRDGKETLIR